MLFTHRCLRSLRLHILVLLALFGSSFSQVAFDKPDFDTGKRPVWIQTADFNGDGIPDFVTANSDGNSISLLLGQSDGTLRSRIDYASGAKPVALVVGDWNNDGLADVAVANFNDNTVSIFLGDGRGGLRLSGSIPVGEGPTGLVKGDFNHDGNLDLAVINSSTQSMTILLGQGNGLFEHSGDYPTGGVPISISTSDFNGDGIPDLVVGNQAGASDSNGAAVFLGDGKGGFSLSSNLNLETNRPISIVTADFNQDGNSDILVWTYSCNRYCTSGLYLFTGHDNGEFDPPTELVAPFGEIGEMIATDLNGDGIPDLAFVSSSQTVATMIGNGDGTFGNLRWLASGRAPVSVVADDINGDGVPDLIVANSDDDTVSVLYGHGDGSMTYRLRYVTGRPDEIVANDFNGDGFVDLAVASSDFQKIWVFPGNGDGTFGAPAEIVTGHPTRSMVSADFNRDGIPDLAIVTVDTAVGRVDVAIYLGRGDGTFEPPVTYPANGGSSMVVADFNDDGFLDLAVTNEGHNSVSILLGNGDGSFQPPIVTSVGAWPDALGVGDFNGDGIPDLAVGHLGDARLFILLGNGDGTFRQGPIYNFANNVSQIAVDDLNHDGVLDLVIGHHHEIAVFLGDGSGGFQHVGDYLTPFPGAYGPFGVRTADINGDGIPDIVTANSVVSVWLGNGDGTFGPRADFSSGGAYRNVIADFDQDGRPDIAVTGYSPSAQVDILLNRTTR